MATQGSTATPHSFAAYASASLANIFPTPTYAPNPGLDISACKTEVSTLQNAVQNQNNIIQNQQQNIDFLNTALPNLSKQLNAINTEIEQQNAAKEAGIISTNIPTLTLAIVLFFVIAALMALYNQFVTKQILEAIEENGVFDALAKAFRKGEFEVEIEGESHPFIFFWTFVLNNIIRIMTRARFVTMVLLFAILLMVILFMYSIGYRGQDIGNAAKIVSLILAMVLVFTFIIVNNQTMNNPFENVVGYSYVRSFSGQSLQEALSHIFKHKYFENKYTFPGANIYYDFILSTLTVKNFPTVLEEIYRNADKYDFKINVDENGINKARVTALYNAVIEKNSVGHMCWMYFASLVGTIISLKYLFASGMLTQ